MKVQCTCKVVGSNISAAAMSLKKLMENNYCEVKDQGVH